MTRIDTDVGLTSGVGLSALDGTPLQMDRTMTKHAAFDVSVLISMHSSS